MLSVSGSSSVGAISFGRSGLAKGADGPAAVNSGPASGKEAWGADGPAASFDQLDLAFGADGPAALSSGQKLAFGADGPA